MSVEVENYKVMKNEDTGAEVYQCNICNPKYGTKKAIRTHVTSKHKPKKKNEDKTDGKSDEKQEGKSDKKSDDKIDDKTDKEVDETEDDPEEFETFHFAGDGAISTQVEKPITVEEIHQFYEEGNSEYLDGPKNDAEKNATKSVIPDDTVDEIIKDMPDDEVDGTKNSSNEPPTEDKDLFTENMLLKSKLKKAESKLKENEQKTLEIETDLIDVNTEITKLKDDKVALEEDIKLKNEQNELLITEKNALEENLARANGTVH